MASVCKRLATLELGYLQGVILSDVVDDCVQYFDGEVQRSYTIRIY